MSARKVLDSYAVLAFLENEPGAGKVEALIKKARDAEKPLLMSAINWGEVYYIVRRGSGTERADETMRAIETLPIEVVDADRVQTRAAAAFKATKKMSYADCFAAALAQVRKAELVTGDKEFKQVVDVIEIEWLE